MQIQPAHLCIHILRVGSANHKIMADRSGLAQSYRTGVVAQLNQAANNYPVVYEVIVIDSRRIEVDFALP